MEQGVNDAFILTTFKLQPKTGTTVFGLYNPRDNSKYFEFTVMGKLNRGMKQLQFKAALINIFMTNEQNVKLRREKRDYRLILQSPSV